MEDQTEEGCNQKTRGQRGANSASGEPGEEAAAKAGVLASHS